MHGSVLFLVLLLLFAGPLAAQCPKLIWSDEFEGSDLDLSKWSFQTGDGCDIGICGWGNNELQYYQEANAEVSNGTLKIIAKQEAVGNKVYTSSRLRSKDKGDWTYGRFEARIKLPTGQGLWPAFWMLSSGEPYGSWPQSGEIDIMELIGREPATVHGTIHFGNPPPSNRSSTASYDLLAGTFDEQFHEFAIEWEPGIIRWYVDDYLYATRSSTVTGSSRWPFDHDFHFLLNVAVGGNWPGSPDGTTRFPQTMEVDYVRVYDGYKPAITGPREVENRAQNAVYEVTRLESGQVEWIIPPTATITAGQGTHQISINWMDEGGELRAVYSGECGKDTLGMQVHVGAPIERRSSLENFDEMGELVLASTTGSLDETAQNPAPDSINNSLLCGRYQRNGADTFDVLTYDTDALDDVSDFLDGQQFFYIDVLTEAPIGTEILLQLENDSRSAPDNYPAGRHSRWRATTTRQGSWDRLIFTLLDRPDASVSNLQIDQLVLLFAPNTNRNDTYYLDNLDIYGPAQVTSAHEPKAVEIQLFPNPARTWLTIRSSNDLSSANFQVLDQQGRSMEVSIDSAQTEHYLKIDSLPPGIYFLRLQTRNGTDLHPFLKY